VTIAQIESPPNTDPTIGPITSDTRIWGITMKKLKTPM
jgi:hypothetical protein